MGFPFHPASNFIPIMKIFSQSISMKEHFLEDGKIRTRTNRECWEMEDERWWPNFEDAFVAA
ncbi:hypothetical protein U1Q18_051197 [Sarracenia purpurea var. burkii]